MYLVFQVLFTEKVVEVVEEGQADVYIIVIRGTFAKANIDTRVLLRRLDLDSPYSRTPTRHGHRQAIQSMFTIVQTRQSD